MHWLVGMLVHAVCVFFFKGGKWEKMMRGTNQHGAVDLDYIPFIDLIVECLNLLFIFNITPASIYHRCQGTTLFVLACFSVAHNNQWYFIGSYNDHLNNIPHISLLL